jgi:hypothetical protein
MDNSMDKNAMVRVEIRGYTTIYESAGKAYEMGTFGTYRH